MTTLLHVIRANCVTCGSLSSTSLKSCAKRFKIRPTGVVSNHHVGHLTMLATALSCEKTLDWTAKTLNRKLRNVISRKSTQKMRK